LVGADLPINYARGYNVNADLHSVDVENVSPPTFQIQQFLIKQLDYIVERCEILFQECFRILVVAMLPMFLLPLIV
jgi:ABC-type uncharacterized transport system involved in gliding motility auxiliary subunit